MASIFFWGGGQAIKFLERDYKIEHASHHVAKFYGYRPRDLGDLALKKIAVKHKAFPDRSGRPNKRVLYCVVFFCGATTAVTKL